MSETAVPPHHPPSNWSVYKEKVPANRLTHLNYAFAKIDPIYNSIVLTGPANDRKNFAAIRKLKQANSKLKTRISVGGWDYSTYFSDIASTSTRRESFAQTQWISFWNTALTVLIWNGNTRCRAGLPETAIGRRISKTLLLLKPIREKWMLAASVTDVEPDKVLI